MSAKVYIVGVVENGAPRDETLVPANPRKPIRYTRGSTLRIDLTIRYPDGSPVDLTDGSPEVRLTIKASSQDEENLLSQAGVISQDASTGEVAFTIGASVFRDYDPGRYVYDIWLTQSGEESVVLPESPFIVEPTVKSLL